jgi:hypothetical protein
LTTTNLLRGVNIPDICPSDVLGGGGEFSLAAGDFGEIYSSDEEKGEWAGVVTCFFIDCVRLFRFFLYTSSYASRFAVNVKADDRRGTYYDTCISSMNS